MEKNRSEGDAFPQHDESQVFSFIITSDSQHFNEGKETCPTASK